MLLRAAPELLGLPRSTRKEPNPPARGDSPVARPLLHFANFEEACDQVVLVTDAEVEDRVESLLDAIRKAVGPAQLAVEAAADFTRIAGTYKSVLSGVSELALFGFLQRLDVQTHPRFDDLRKHFIEMQWRIQELSEVDLRASEAQRI